MHENFINVIAVSPSNYTHQHALVSWPGINRKKSLIISKTNLSRKVPNISGMRVKK